MRRPDVLPIDVEQLQRDLFMGAVEAAQRAIPDLRRAPAVQVVEPYVQRCKEISR